MKQINIYLGICLALLIGLVACSVDEEKVVGKATIRVGVQVDASVLTRADDATIKLKIVETNIDGTPIEGAPTTEYSVVSGEEKELSLKATTYSITAIAGNDPQGKPTSDPFYSGSASVTLTSGETKQILIECKLTTAVIAVDYTGLTSYVSNGYDFQTVVQIQGSADKIVFSKEDANKNGYFLPTGMLSVTFRYGKKEIWQEIQMKDITNILAQHKYTIRYSEKDQSETDQPGSAGIVIEVEQPSGTGDQIKVDITLPKLALAIEELKEDQVGDVFADVYGTALLNNGMTINELFFEYGEIDGSEVVPSSKEIPAQKQSEKWYANLDNLKPATRYRVWVKDHKDINQEFTTKAITHPTAGWPTFAYLTATYSKKPDLSQVKFQYKMSQKSDWTDTNVNISINAKGEYVTKLTGLTPSTEYQYRFVSGSLEGNVETFMTDTEVERQLPNSNFDLWAKGGKTWFAGTSEEANAKNAFWDSGNVGAATMNKNPSSPEDTDVHTAGGKSAKLSSQFVGIFGIGKFAAGNLYVGRYMQTYTSPMGARIRFGREFNSRPTQFKGWYKYSRGAKIDYGSHNKAELEQSGGDKCALYIALTDNEGLIDEDGVKTAYEVDNNKTNSPTQYTIDLSENNKDIIAYGSITDEQSKGAAGWTEFTVDLKYRDLTRKPKFIIVVASASKYGDFFTGSSKSVMTIDDFELVYGDNPVSQ